MSRPPEQQGRKGYMIVRLSYVPVEKRQRAAERIIRQEGLVAEAALELMLAAFEPRVDPWLIVPTEIAERVLR